MIISKTSMFSGKVNTMDLAIKPEDYMAWVSAGNDDPKRHIQNAFPNLSADEREFLISGVSPDEWNEMFESSEG